MGRAPQQRSDSPSEDVSSYDPPAVRLPPAPKKGILKWPRRDDERIDSRRATGRWHGDGDGDSVDVDFVSHVSKGRRSRSGSVEDLAERKKGYSVSWKDEVRVDQSYSKVSDAEYSRQVQRQKVRFENVDDDDDEPEECNASPDEAYLTKLQNIARPSKSDKPRQDSTVFPSQMDEREVVPRDDSQQKKRRNKITASR